MAEKNLTAGPYALDPEGQKIDAFFHEAMLESKSGTLASDYAAIQQGMANGLSLALAVRYYASPVTKEWLTVKGVKF
jgi:hypothetical protein